MSNVIKRFVDLDQSFVPRKKCRSFVFRCKKLGQQMQNDAQTQESALCIFGSEEFGKEAKRYKAKK